MHRKATSLGSTGDKSRDQSAMPRRHQKRRRGATVTEFAVVAPIFFLLLFGSIELARMNMLRHAAENAAYEAARHALVPGGTSAEATARANAVLGVFGFHGAGVAIDPVALDDDDQEIKVTVEVPIDQNAWVFPRFSQGKKIIGVCELRTERYRPLQ